jgi:hypothetical protein
MGEDSGDLMEVSQVVSHPGSEKLGKSNGAERWVQSSEFEVGEGEMEGLELGKVLGAQGCKLTQKLRQGFPLALALLAQPVKGLESRYLRAWNIAA